MRSTRMSRRDFLRGLTAASALPLLSACATAVPTAGTGAEEAADISTGAVDTAVRSGGISYEQQSAVFNQEPITLEVWDWHTPRIDMWNRWYAQYTDLYPNVQFNVTQVPFAEYETKLPAAIPAGQGPDMFFLKWTFHPTLVHGGMVAPYPDEGFPRQVVADWFEGFPMNAGPEGRVYWLPVGVMSGGIFRNVDLWEEAGLTDDDIPETWDELVDVAKKLTKFDDAGRMVQSGLNINDAIPSIINYLIYQQGAWMFNEGYTRPLYDREETRRALQYFLDLYDVHQVCDRNFLPWMESFGTGSAAMVFAWSWYSGYLNVNSPDIPYMVSRCPTWTGDFEPAIGPGALDPESFAVPTTTPSDRMQVSFDAIQWLFSQDEFLVEHIMTAGSPPGAKQIQEHERILENQTIRALLPQTPYVLTVLGAPPLLGNIERQYLYEGVFQANMSIDEAMQQAQAEGERIMATGEWPINEREYQYADLMQPPVE